MLNKKGVSPVVAIALLLVTAVVAVVGFQGWFETYSSGVFVKVEQDSESGNMNTQIEALVGSNLYIKNGYDNLTITDIKVNGRSCNITQSYTDNITEIDLGNCTDNLTTSTPEIVVITDNGILSKKIFVKEQEILPKVITYSACPTTNFVDDFSGADGDLPNTMWWRTLAGYPIINNSQLYFKNTSYDVISNFTLVGDFDIQVYWTFDSLPSDSNGYFQILNDSNILNSPKNVRWYRASLLDRNVVTDGNNYYYTPDNWPEAYFRFKRVGNNIECYKSEAGSSWTHSHTFSNAFSENKLYVRLYTGGSANPIFRFDNFKINSVDSVENLLCED